MRRLRTIDTPGSPAPDPIFTLAGPIADIFTRAGYVCVDDYLGRFSPQPSYVIFATYPPARIGLGRFAEEVRPYAVAELRRLAADPSILTTDRRDAASMADRLEARAAGTARYLRRTALAVRDRLPDVGITDGARIMADARAERPKTQAARPAEYHRDYRARRKDAARLTTARALPKWLAHHVEPGRHDVSELWSRWSTEVVPALREKAPELADLGRTGFYEVLADVADVRNGGGHTRYVVVTNATSE